MPRPMKKLDRDTEKAKNWFVECVGNMLYEDTHTLFAKKFIVNLASRTCSCNLWILVGIIQQNRKKLEDYVHAYYHRKTYAKIYNHTMNPINGEGR